MFVSELHSSPNSRPVEDFHYITRGGAQRVVKPRRVEWDRPRVEQVGRFHGRMNGCATDRPRRDP